MQMQELPLEVKILKTKQRIREFYEFYNGMVAVSVSGGLDSTVLLHIVREVYPEVQGVFVNTGLEYPENVKFVEGLENVKIIRPRTNFKQVIETYGFPVISKDQADYLQVARESENPTSVQRVLGDGRYSISKKYRYLIDAPFKISARCCDELKIKPLREYEGITGNHAIIGNRAQESRRRTLDFLRGGCNSFSVYNPVSKPLSFWMHEDIINYIKEFNIPYSKLYDMGYDRSGCMYCMFGVQLEVHPNRFERMRETHPKMYDYCINKLGLGNVLDYIGVSY